MVLISFLAKSEEVNLEAETTVEKYQVVMDCWQLE